MIINLQTLTKDEDIGSIIEKLNANFSQISTLGGGPQGLRGKQGLPGLPGLRGISGPNGESGNDGIIVQFIGSDENWDVLYAGDPNQNVDASNAINQGYNVGDIWIDNANGVFYEIVETTPGIFEFVPRPISPAALSSGEFFVSDTNSNRDADGVNKGVRNANRFASFSVTSTQKGTPTDPGDTAEYDENDLTFSQIGGYNRSAFKLSLDQLTTLDRVNAPSNNLAFMQQEFGDFSPILYLGSSDNPETSLGFLHGYFSNLEGDTRMLLLSGNDGSAVLSTFGIDTDFIGVESKNMYFSSSSSSGINMLNPATPEDSEFWLAYSLNPGVIPAGTSSITNTFGLRLFIDNANTRGNIEFYTAEDSTADNAAHVMTINGLQKVNIGDTPSNILESRFSVHAKPTEEHQIAWFLNNPATDDIHLGIGITIDDTDPSPEIRPMIYSETGLTGTKTPAQLVLQPDGIYKSDWDDFTDEQRNDGEYAGTGVGHTDPKSRLSISGNLTVGKRNIQAPDEGMVVEGNVLFSGTASDTFALSALPLNWPQGFQRSPGVFQEPPTDNAKFTIGQNFKFWNFFTNDSDPGQNGLSYTFFLQDEQASRMMLSSFTKKLVFGIEPVSFNSDTVFKGQDIVLSHGGNTVFGIPNEFPYLSLLDPKQRVAITKKSVNATEGLQITDGSIGYEADEGFQFRTNGEGHGQIYMGQDKKIEIFVRKNKRYEINNDGRTTIRPTTTIIYPFEEVKKGTTLRIQGDEYTDTYNQEVNIGAMNGDAIAGMSAGAGYVGYNAFYDDEENDVVFKSNPGDTTPNNGAGVFTFSDSIGGYHIACSYLTTESGGGVVTTPPVLGN